MGRYVLARVLQLVPTLLGVSIVVFVLMRMIGDPTALVLPPEATPQQRAEFRHVYGFDRPWPVQYVDYLGHLLRGDFGQSLAYRQPALSLVLGRAAATLELAAAAMAVVLLVGIPAGIVAAVRRNSLLDHLATVGVLLGQSITTFWLGIMLILVFAVHWQWLPVSGRGDGDPRYLVLPAVTLAAYYTALIARLTRSGLLEVLGQDYVRTARAKGLHERAVILRHALRNSLIPVVTVLGLQFGGLLGGAIVTETVFQWPGVGTLVLEAISRRDYAIVQAVVLLLAIAYVVINLGVDILYGVFDPRIQVAQS